MLGHNSVDTDAIPITINDQTNCIPAVDVASIENLYTCYGPELLAYLGAVLGNQQAATRRLQNVMQMVAKGAARYSNDLDVRLWLFQLATRGLLDVTSANDTLDSEMQNNVLLGLPIQNRIALLLIFSHQMNATDAAMVMQLSDDELSACLRQARRTLTNQTIS